MVGTIAMPNLLRTGPFEIWSSKSLDFECSDFEWSDFEWSDFKISTVVWIHVRYQNLMLTNIKLKSGNKKFYKNLIFLEWQHLHRNMWCLRFLYDCFNSRISKRPIYQVFSSFRDGETLYTGRYSKVFVIKNEKREAVTVAKVVKWLGYRIVYLLIV